VDVDAGVCENDKLIRYTWDWIEEHPLEAVVLSFEHMFDLFVSIPWPGSSTGRTYQIAQAMACQAVAPPGAGAPVWPQAVVTLRVTATDAATLGISTNWAGELDKAWETSRFVAIPWPGSGTQLRPLLIGFMVLFYVGVLLPAVVHLWRHRRALVRLDPRYAGELLVLMPVLAVMITAFIFLGEARYRIPFDGFLLLLAARAYCGSRPEDPLLVPGVAPQ
jgi:hypothetical protein